MGREAIENNKMERVMAMGRGRRETGFFQSLFNAITGSGTTIRRTTDFWGHPRTVVHNYDTGATKEYTHNKGLFGTRTDVKVYRDGKRVGKGNINRDFWGHDVETVNYGQGRVRKSVKKMNCGFWGNKDKVTHYDANGSVVGSGSGRRGMILSGYSRSYSGRCFRCNGTGVFQRTGEPCRKCGGTGVYRRNG